MEKPSPYPSKPKDGWGPSVELDGCRVGLQLDGCQTGEVQPFIRAGYQLPA